MRVLFILLKVQKSSLKCENSFLFKIIFAFFLNYIK